MQGTIHRARSLRGRIATLIGLALVLPLAAQGMGHAASPNLAPNPGFEESAFEPAPVPQYTQPQPLLPTGWVFEGSAGLFDHSPNAKRSGKRSAAISVPASGKRTYCGPEYTCVNNPAQIAKDAVAPYYTVNPAWRTARPIPVTAGKKYVFSTYVQMVIASVGEGAFTRVRWVDANGLLVRNDDGASRIQKVTDADTTAWENITRTLTAPTGATGAILLLGATDDSWISQVIFDDVYFGLSLV